MVTRKWVVIFQHPYYPEIYLFDSWEEANEKFNELKENNHAEDGHHENCYLYVGEMSGWFEKI